MKSEQLKQHHTYYNEKLIDADSFFKEFGELDDETYSDGAISKKNK